MKRLSSVLENVARDIRYALRTLRKSPAFTVSSVAVLALAIGANTAMFSVLNAVLFRPLPYRAPEQLVMLWTEDPDQNLREGRSAYWNIEQWRSHNRSFSDIAFFDSVSVTLTSADAAEQISAARVSPNLFALLGIPPLHGRIFSPEEAERQERLSLISYRFWQARFGGSLDALGASIEIEGRPSRIVGILPESFEFAGLAADIWELHTLFPDWEELCRSRGSGFWSVIGRLRPDVTAAQAQAEMSGIARGLNEQLPASFRSQGVAVVPLGMQLTGPAARLALWLLAGAIFCVLLIAAANIAGLLLARSASREREMIIRMALGAGRARLAGQLVAESLTLAALAGVAGLLVAVAGIRGILAVKPGGLARLNEVSLDPRVLVWTSALCVLVGVLIGFAPALSATLRDLSSTGSLAGRGMSGGIGMRRLRRVLVVTQFALSIVLLSGAGLLLRSLWSVENVQPGFTFERVLSVQLSTPAFSSPRRADIYARVIEQVAAINGVEGAGIIGDLFIGGSPEQIVTTASGAERLRLRRDEVSDGLFQALQIPLLRGRFFSREDGPDAPPRAIVNDAMARRLWPGRDPIGERFKLGAADADKPWFSVVGVVGNIRRQGLENAPGPQMFEPLAQNPSRLATLLVRTSAIDPLSMAGMIRAAVHRVEKRVPVYGVTSLDKRLEGYLGQRRFQTSLLIGFSLAALLMAAIGIYGLIQYSVATRTREIGLRMAVGARAIEVFRMVIGEGLKLTFAGLVLGLACSSWLGRAVSSLLFGVSATDPPTLIAVSLLLTAVAAAACYFPARRAMRIEPVTALRQE